MGNGAMLSIQGGDGRPLNTSMVSDGGAQNWVEVPSDGVLSESLLSGGRDTWLEGYEYRRHEAGATSMWVALGFPGQYYDGETGYFENWNRYYDARTGRYLQSEPMAVDSIWLLNRATEGVLSPMFSYASNNPAAFVDSDGLQSTILVTGRPMMFPGPTPLLVPKWFVGVLVGEGRLLGASLGVWGGACGWGCYVVRSRSYWRADSGDVRAGLVVHIDAHIENLDTPTGCGSPDPNDLNERYRKGWVKELRAAIKNLKQAIEKMPNNTLRRGPSEQAIQRAEAAIRQYGQ